MNNETILWNIAPEWENRNQDKKLEKMLLFFADMHKTHAAASKLNVLEDYFRKESEWNSSFDWVQFHSGNLFDHYVPEKYGKAGNVIDEKGNALLDEGIALCKRYGKKVCHMIGDFAPLTCILDAYPEMKNLHNGMFWQLLYDMVDGMFKRFPDLDEMGVYFFESKNVLHCDNFFKPFHYGSDLSEKALADEENGKKGPEDLSYPYLSFGDHIRMMLMAMTKACKDNGKSFLLLTHAWFPYQEEILYEALKNFPSDLPLTLEHNYTTGDFNPALPQPKLIGLLPHLNHGLVFCCGMEYHGLGLVPCCFPEIMEERIRDALAATPNLKRVTMRPIWDGCSALDTPNEVNLYALMKMADDPGRGTEELWHEWLLQKYGLESEDRQELLAAALRNGYKAVQMTFFEFGIRTNDHSHIQTFQNLESRLYNYGKALMKWCPTPENKQTIYDLFVCPGGKILRRNREVHEEAIQLVHQALQKVEGLREVLEQKDYEDLRQRFDVLKTWITIHGFQYEAYMRLLIQRRKPELENHKKAEEAMTALLEYKQRIERGEIADSYLFSLWRIDEFVEDCRRELKELENW